MKRDNSIKQDFTSGNIPRQLLRFSVPFMLSNALQVAYSLVDMLVVGKFVGSYGLAAVSNASQIMLFCTMLCLGFATGAQVMIAQQLGAKRRDLIRRTIGTTFSFIGVLAVVMTLAVMLLRRQALNWIDIPTESRAMALSYLTVCGSGLVFTFGYNVVSAVLRGMGNSKHPFLFILIASVVNLVLDLLFTGVLGWGVTGAAAATVIGQAVSFLFALQFLYRKREAFGFDFHLKSFAADRVSLRLLVKLGVPYAIQSCAVNVSMIYVNSLVNNVGVYASAAFGVGVKLDDIASKLTQGIMYAVSPMVGQNMGAGNARRIRQATLWAGAFSIGLYVLFTTLYLAWSEQMFALFTSDAEVLRLAPVFVSAVVWGFPAMAIMRSPGGFVQGIGNAQMSMTLGILDGVVFRVALSYLLGITAGLGFFGFVLGFSTASYVYAIPSLIYFISGRWQENRTLVSHGEIPLMATNQGAD